MQQVKKLLEKWAMFLLSRSLYVRNIPFLKVVFRPFRSRVLTILAIALCSTGLLTMTAKPASSAIPAWTYIYTSFNTARSLVEYPTPIAVCLAGVRNQSGPSPIGGARIDYKRNVGTSFPENTAIINICIDQGNANVALVTFVTSPTTAERSKYFAQLKTYHEGLRQLR